MGRMAFVCPDCRAPALEIGRVLALPPVGVAQEFSLQLVACSACRFQGVAVYEESRAGSLDSESVDHGGYRVDSATFERLSELAANCPSPRDEDCGCETHRALGVRDPHRGLGAWLQQIGIDFRGGFPMEWSDAPRANATATFLGSPADAKLTLRDVQGLWGGRNVFLLGSGVAHVQIVNAAIWEQRFELRLSPEEVRRLFALVVEQDFVTIQIPVRMGIPDEAEPTMTLIGAGGKSHTVRKWAGQKDARFDAIYAELRGIAERARGLAPVYQGPFDGRWAPEGFGRRAGA